MSGSNTLTIQTQKYPVLDSIAKGYLIDAPTTFVMLSLCHGSKAWAAMPFIIASSLLNGAVASVSYLIRTDARENGNPSLGGLEAGALKYVGRDLLSYALITQPDIKGKVNIKSFSKKLLMQAGVGALNNYAYEKCLSNEACRDDTKASFSLITIVEAIDAGALVAVQGKPGVLSGVAIGGLSGVIGFGFAYFVCLPLLDSLHNAYDVVSFDPEFQAIEQYVDFVDNQLLELIGYVYNSTINSIEYNHTEF